IEQDADCQMAVYGNTVAIIAPLETIEVAVNAVFKIMQGQPHSAVYMYLEKAKKRMKEESLKESLGISL
ncbi:RNA-processing protein, partial [Candidatus Micrarchaeota archaeon CG11_big_fil_rev_8_21_14_0_20_47_5]